MNPASMYSQRYKLSRIKTIIPFLIWLMVMASSGCATQGSENVPETQVKVAVSTNQPTTTSTATQEPTSPPATDTPEPTEMPSPTPLPTEGNKREQVTISYEEKILRGTLVGNGGIAVVLAPMYGQSRGSWMHFADRLADTGFTALAFDFPGPFGTSAGEFKFDKVQYDVLAVVNYLRELGYEYIVCIGASIGATACFEAALIDPDLSGVAVVSSPVEASDEQLASLLLPKLLVFGTDDEMEVEGPLRDIFQKMEPPKQIESINKKGHGTELLNVGNELGDILMDFMESVRSGIEQQE